IARAILASTSGSESDTGIVIGTPGYMSPEVVMGDLPVDGRSDVYSLGSVLYHALAGAAPGTGSTRGAQAVAMLRLAARMPPIGELRDGLPAAAERAIMASLARFPADRPTAVELRDALGGAE